MVEMQLVAVRVELPTNTPVVLLQETGGSARTLPIFIGTTEATAIAYAMQGVETPRPLTHDLMKDMLDAGDVDVTSIVITELQGSTYFAEINLRHGANAYSVSSRPSDAIALAARTHAPIFASDELVDAEAVVLAPGELDAETEEPSEQEEQLVSEFRSFIDDVKPEDFSPPSS